MNQPQKNALSPNRWRGILVAGLVIAAIVWVISRIKRSYRQNGLTLLEVLIAAGMLGLIGLGVIRAIDANARAGRVLDEQVQATNLITAYMENMRQSAYDDSGNAYASIGANVTKPVQFSVVTNIQYSGDGSTWSSTNASGSYKLQRVSVSVMRTSGKIVLTTCTFRTRR